LIAIDTSDLNPTLRTACTIGDLSLAESAYKEVVQKSASSKTYTLSQMAIMSAKNSHPAILSFCFSEGLELNPEHVNDPVVYAACDSGCVAVFRVFLDNGLDVNRYLETEGNPLTSACYDGNLELVKFLLDKGADPNTGYGLGHYEALVWAIVGQRASLDIVQLLLAYNVEVKGTGALIAAAKYGNLGAVKLFLDKTDADLEEVEEYGDWDERKLDDMGTALYKAAAGGRGDIVDVLLEKGADVRFRDRTGRSVADVAKENGHADIVKRLRPRNAAPEMPS